MKHFKSPMIWIGIGISVIGGLMAWSELEYITVLGIIIICTGLIIANNA